MSKYEILSNLVEYKDGRFYRKDTGDFADKHISDWGYRTVRISVQGKRLYIAAHRLAWYMAYGVEPTGQIDHIDRDTLNNKINNLRDVSQSINQHNRKAKGYTIEKSTGKYYAQIKLHGKQHFLGRYDTPEQATEAYLEAKKMLHPTSPIIGGSL